MSTMAVSYIDRSTLSVLAPSVTKALDISESQYGWLTAAFSLAYLLASPLAGRWIDRAGARRGLVYSVMIWSIVAAMHALVPGLVVLFALRIGLGVAEGPSFPGAAQTVHRALPPGDRSRGFGTLFIGSSLGAMIAPPLASLLYREAGWRVAFLGTAAIGVLWIPIWIAVTHTPAAAAQLDAREPVTTSPPRFWEVALHPIVVRAVIAILALAPTSGLFQAWGAKFLVRRFGIDQGDVGDYLWLPPLLFDTGAILMGDLAARIHRAPNAPPRALFALAALATATIAFLPLAGTPWQAIACVAFAVLGCGGAYTLVASDMFARMPAGSLSAAGGMLAAAQSLALIIANPLIGAAVEHTGNYRGVSIAIGLWVLPGALIWWWWRPPDRFVSSPP